MNKDLRNQLLFCLACFILSRLLVLGVAYATFYSYPSPPAPPGYAATQGPLDRRPLNVLYFYDAVHYTNIADRGYALPETPWFPLYPLLIRIFGGTAGAAVVLSNMLFLASLPALYLLGGKMAVVLACVSPIAIVFSAAYSESLFFCISAWFLWCLKERRTTWAAMLAGLGALCRSPGWALVAVLAWSQVYEALKTRKLNTKGTALAGVALLIGLAYPVFEALRFGSPIANAVAVNVFYPHRRCLMPFWWGLTADIQRILAGSFSPGMEWLIMVNLSGFLWMVLSFYENVPSALLYGLFVLSFPVTNPNYMFATFGSLRYFCCWPGAYSGASRKLANKTEAVLVTVVSLLMALGIASLVAQKVFLF